MRRVAASTKAGSCALVVDGNPTSRNVLAGQMRNLGLGLERVETCATPQDARRWLDKQPFDIVICDQHFTGTEYTGSQLLDELRQAGALPLSTVSIIVSSQPTYDAVAEAAESALDGYLVKPYSAAALTERIKHAQRRKATLKEISQTIDRGDFQSAAHLCVNRFAKREAFWMYSARVGAELLLRLGRAAEAKRLLAAVVNIAPHSWARLGIARADIQASKMNSAIDELNRLTRDDLTCVDALDVLGRAHCEQGDFDKALKIYKQAVEATPSSTPRLQRLGLMALYRGDHAQATQVLERAVHLGSATRLFDQQTLAALAIGHLALKDQKGVRKACDRLHSLRKHSPADLRLRRLELLARVASHAMADHKVQLRSDLDELMRDRREEDFSPELACLALALLVQLNAEGHAVDQADGWVQSLARRYCVSNGMSHMLLMLVANDSSLLEVVNAAQAHVLSLAERAMKHTLDGNPQATAAQLLQDSQATLNAKLIELANGVLSKHQDRIEDAALLQDEVNALRRMYSRPESLPTLTCDLGRAPGSLMLRVGAAKAAESALASV